MPTYTTENELLDAQPILKRAMPKGWRTLGPLERRISLDGREPFQTWQLRIQWATEIDGGSTVYYGGKTAVQPSARRLEVTLCGGSIDDLLSVLKAFPARELETLAALRWPIEVHIESVLLP